jgi:hypothetical protein
MVLHSSVKKYRLKLLLIIIQLSKKKVKLINTKLKIIMIIVIIVLEISVSKVKDLDVKNDILGPLSPRSLISLWAIVHISMPVIIPIANIYTI